MKLEVERKLIVQYGIKMLESGLTVGTSGNISIYNKNEHLIAISPSGVDYGRMNIEDVVITNIQGEVIEGAQDPSSEIDLHRLFYVNRKDVLSVVHTHSKFATILACLNKSIPSIHPIIACAGTSNEIQCAPYMPSHTANFGSTVLEKINHQYALLLGNHGVVSCGPSIEYAYLVAEMTEFCANLYYHSLLIGKPYLLDAGEMQDMTNRFEIKRNIG